jgi:hypothetical protein
VHAADTTSMKVKTGKKGGQGTLTK